MKTAQELRRESIQLSDLKKIPNILSSFRLLSSIAILVAGILLIDQLWVGAIYIVSIVSDKLDGIIARRTNSQTKLGLVLEMSADSFLSVAIAVFLACNRELPSWMIFVALTLFALQAIILLVVYLRKHFFFISSLQSARVAIFFLHIAALMYYFRLPYKEIGLASVVVTGLYAYIENNIKTLRAKSANG